MLKRIASILSALLFLVLFSVIPASAHPGKTDEQGGHFDRSTGEYHWHHGYSAHQHLDKDGDGIAEYCPYEFKDNTDNSSKASSSASIHENDHWTEPEKPVSLIPTYATASTEVASTEVASTEVASTEVASTVSVHTRNNQSATREDATIMPLWTLWIIIPVILVLVVLYRSQEKDIAHLFAENENYKKTVEDKEQQLEKVNQELKSSNSALANITLQLDDTNNKLIRSNQELNKSNSALTNITLQLNDTNKKLIKSNLELKESIRDVACLSDLLSKEHIYNGNLRSRNSALESAMQEMQIEDDSIRRDYNFLLESMKQNIPRKQAESLNLFSSEHRIMPGDYVLDDLKIIVPPGIEFAEDGYPICGKATDFTPYGEYTVFIAARSRVYHSCSYCSGTVLRATNLFRVIPQRKPCSRCAVGKKYPSAIPGWYEDIVKLQKLHKVNLSEKDAQ